MNIKLIQYALILLLSCKSVHAALKTNGSPQQPASTSEVTWEHVDWKTTFLCKYTTAKERFFKELPIKLDEHNYIEQFNGLPITQWDPTLLPPSTRDLWLTHAIECEYLPAVETLLKGRDLDEMFTHEIKYRSYICDSPLILAARMGCLGVLQFLLRNGASVNIKSRTGCTALHCAVCNNQIDAIKLLLAHGAFIDARTQDNSTPLHDAAANNHLDAVKILLHNGAFIDSQNDSGDTPLFCAIYRDNLSIVKYLLQNGASTIILNQEGETPLSLAQELGHTKIVQLLTEHIPHEQ